MKLSQTIRQFGRFHCFQMPITKWATKPSWMNNWALNFADVNLTTETEEPNPCNLLGAVRWSDDAAEVQDSTTELDRGCWYELVRSFCLQLHSRELDVPRYNTRDSMPLPFWLGHRGKGVGRSRRPTLFVCSHRPITHKISWGAEGRSPVYLPCQKNRQRTGYSLQTPYHVW